jgi:hypothetical protein
MTSAVTTLTREQPVVHPGKAAPPTAPVFRIVTIKVNNQCPLRCRHCAVGFSHDYKGDNRRFSPDDLAEIIAAINPQVYSMVLFAGGEPALEPALLRAGIACCRAKHLLSAIVTSPVWAPNGSAAGRFLDSIPGLNAVILSYDRYHLEFLKLAHYEAAIRAAVDRRLIVSFHICYTQDSELVALLDQIVGLRHLINAVHSVRTMPFGNAANPDNVKMEGVRVTNSEDLARIPRGCVLGHVQIDLARSVHGCCWSRFAVRSPFSLPAVADGIASALAQLETKRLFGAMRAHGFIDSLTPKGREAVARMAGGREFANECHLCVTAMNEGGPEIWDQCGRHPEPNP